MPFIQSFHLSVWQWAFILAAAFLTGFSKTGISGFIMIVIPILASIFGGKDSTGILLPMLLAGDIWAVSYYHRHAEWGDIRRLLPWSFAGLILGGFVGGYINDRQFKILIAICVIKETFYPVNL